MTDLDISKGLIIRELKQLWWWPQQQLQKTIGFMRKKNSSAHLSHFSVHFFDIHWMTSRWNPDVISFLEDIDTRWQILLSLFEPG